jgi:phospholipase/carboxylesterase
MLMLHGYGADKQNLFPLVEDYANTFSNFAYVSLDAPEVCEQGSGRQWFSLNGYNPSNFINLAEDISLTSLQIFQNEIIKTFTYLDEHIEKISKLCGVPSENIILLGFSQGASVATAYALCSSRKTLGVLSFSSISTFEANQITNKVPVFLAHGAADNVVPFSSLIRSTNILDSAKVPLKVCPVSGLGHIINSEEISQSVEFLDDFIINPANPTI